MFDICICTLTQCPDFLCQTRVSSTCFVNGTPSLSNKIAENMKQNINDERSILIGSLSGRYFAIWTAKMVRSQNDCIDLCLGKYVQKKTDLC